MGIYQFIGTTPKAEYREVEDPRQFIAYWAKRRQYTDGKVEYINMLQPFEKRDRGYVFIGYTSEQDLKKIVEKKGLSWDDVVIIPSESDKTLAAL